MASVTLQATTPGTQETGNSNISGTAIAGVAAVGAGTAAAPAVQVGSGAKGFFEATTNDVGIAANGVEVVRFGPDTGNGVPRQTRFSGPVFEETTIGATSGGIPEAVRIVSHVASGATGTGPFAGLNITNDTLTGNDVVMDAFYHALQVNVGVNSPVDSNEVAAGEFFIFQSGYGSVFGIEAHPYTRKEALGFPPNMPAISRTIHDDKNSGTNQGSHFGILLINSSTGRPVSGAGFYHAIQCRRDTGSDYTTGTVSTNGTTTVTGNGTEWAHVGGEPGEPYVNLADKKIRINGSVYTIASVVSDTSLTVDTNVPSFNGSYRIRVSEPWSTDVLLDDSSREGIRIQQDPNFPPDQGEKAIRVRNQDNSSDVHSVAYDGTTFVSVNNGTQIPLIVSAAGDQSTSMQEWQESTGVARSRINKHGSLLTAEANRVSPWIEPEWVAANATTINSTTAADIDPSGTTKVSFTPGCDLRIQISAVFDLQAISYGNAIFVGELDLYYGGTDHAQSGQAIFNPGGTTIRATVSQVWNLTLTAGTTYTIKLRGRLNIQDNVTSYNVAQTHTKFSLIALGRF